MKTKALSLTVLFLFTAISVFSQGLGIQAGVNFQNLNGKDATGDKLENKLNIGFHGGLNYQIPVAPEFYFQPGVLFTTKGAKSEDGEIKTSISYIEVPLNVVYKGLLGSGHVLLGFGPYLAYGIGGKMAADDDDVKIKFKNEVTLAEIMENPYLKALDAGGNIFFGYELENGLFCTFNAQLGMLSINPKFEGEDDSDATIKNTGFGLSLGFRF